MTKRVRNLGFSLIELIVAFAVLGVATLGIGSLFVVATRSSNLTQKQSNIYSESQFATIQIERILQNAELAISYGYTTTKDQEKATAFVLQDEEISGTAAEKVLYIFNGNSNAVSLQLLKWSADTKEILYKEFSGNMANISNISLRGTDWELLAEDVEEFYFSMKDENNKVSLRMKFEDKVSQTSDQTISLRNQILKNPESVDDIVETILATEAPGITQVRIDVNPKILAPNAAVQLSSNVKEIGISSDYKTVWYVATSSNMDAGTLVGDSSDPSSPIQVDNNGFMSVTLTNAIRNHTGSFYVQAVVTGGGKTVESNIEEFKIVEDMIVTIDNEETEKASLTSPKLTRYEVSSGSLHKMNASIVGEGLLGYEKNVVWSIENASAGIHAAINANGELLVENTTAGNFDVVAVLEKNPSAKVVFPCYVDGTSYAEGTVLSLSPIKESVYRGGETGFQVLLNGRTIDSEDCNWSASLYYVDSDNVSHLENSAYLTVGASGMVTVNEYLRYDRAYKIVMTASLKSNSQIVGNCTVDIPEVSVHIVDPKGNLYRGGDSMKLYCYVIGLEDYQLEWSMSRSTLPAYFFKEQGDTYLRAVQGTNGLYDAVEVKLGENEASDVIAITVKAELVQDSTKRALVAIQVVDE